MSRFINASEFRVKCLALLDEVALTGEPITILKRGKIVAQLVPASGLTRRFPQDELAGSVIIHGDIISPGLEPADWEAESGETQS
jgi:antitoxin (DNA-binding transcriptional repressor) of toxin-antitoxin stability system